ncbi:unnamed protein product [Anisakis simplex]|uniref:TIR domain-containing protein n=1 Tax=Anisakis simplex TaxID=6269 RepID=A0A0M3K3M4_ANISI|nr:unnamed protein product [Anisakis simplex]
MKANKPDHAQLQRWRIAFVANRNENFVDVIDELWRDSWSYSAGSEPMLNFAERAAVGTGAVVVVDLFDAEEVASDRNKNSIKQSQMAELMSSSVD